MASDPVLSRHEMIAWCKAEGDHWATVDETLPDSPFKRGCEARAQMVRAIAQALQEDEHVESKSDADSGPDRIRVGGDLGGPLASPLVGDYGGTREVAEPSDAALVAPREPQGEFGSLSSDEQELVRVFRQNKCGDTRCEGARFSAAQSVLKGAVTHYDVATMVHSGMRDASLAGIGDERFHHPPEAGSDAVLVPRLQPENGERLRQFGELLQEEMEARGWTTATVAAKIAGYKQLELDLLLAVAETADEHVIVNDETLRELDVVFGVSEGFFTRILRPAARVREG